MNSKTIFWIIIFTTFLGQIIFAQTPEIKSIDKTYGTVGEVVTIFGSGFDSNPANLRVFFGGAQGRIIYSQNDLIEVIYLPEQLTVIYQLQIWSHGYLPIRINDFLFLTMVQLLTIPNLIPRLTLLLMLVFLIFVHVILMEIIKQM